MDIETLNEYLSAEVNIFHKKNRVGVGEGRAKRDLRVAQVSTITYITEQPYKNETICFLVNNRPRIIPKLCPNYITIKEIKAIEKRCPEIYYHLPYEMYTIYPDLINLLINNNLVVYDFLPMKVRHDPKVQESFSKIRKAYREDLKDKLDYDEKWVNKDGKLREYFKLKDNFPIKDKEDYLKIIKFYLTSGLSIQDFCQKYGISNNGSFIDLLNRAEYEILDLQEELQEAKDAAFKRYTQSLKKIANYLDEGKITFTDYLESYYDPHHKFDLLFHKVKNKNILMKQIVSYIIDNKENLKLDRIINLFDTNIDDLFKIIISYCRLAKISNPKINQSLYSIINIYKKLYFRKEVLAKITINGETQIIDDDVIDKALVYLKNNDIYICYYTVSNTAKKIAFGKLDYDYETQMAKEELKEEIIRATLLRVKTIEEYMQVMEENYSIQGL